MDTIRWKIHLTPSNEGEEQRLLETERLERLANTQHEIWSSWMEYLFSLCSHSDAGDAIIPKHSVVHWKRQIETPYNELTEVEKESDRNEARKVIAAL